ncbi:MAG: hypothetical protein U0263_06305 [Polyangiaceae bacterium]
MTQDVTQETGCKSVQPPTPPVGADNGGNIEFAVAVRELNFGDRTTGSGPTWPTLGYDLDKLCTCDLDKLGSCKAINKVVCDGIDGRDNGFGGFLFQMRDTFKVQELSSENVSAGIETGNNTVLIRVRGYNGSANDGVVEVSWFASDDFDFNNPNPPKWDGTDVWSVLSSSLTASTGADGGTSFSVDAPKYTDNKAFVRDGTLVVSLPEGAFALSSKRSIGFSAAIFTGKLQQGSNGWKLEEGILAGIAKVGELLGLLPTIDDPITQQPICMDNLVYSGVKSLICDAPDMTVIATPSKTCDYISLGIGMRADPVLIGPVSVQKDPVSPCAAGQDPSKDTC